MAITNFIGEFECKLDAKGRLMLPSNLRKQLDPSAQERFVMNRGFEKCLVLYPKNDWEYISAEVNKLNQYVKKNREFRRSLFIIKDIKRGERFTETNIRSIRPGYGLSPKYFKKVLDKEAKRDIEKGTPLSWDLIR